MPLIANDTDSIFNSIVLNVDGTEIDPAAVYISNSFDMNYESEHDYGDFLNQIDYFSEDYSQRTRYLYRPTAAYFDYISANSLSGCKIVTSDGYEVITDNISFLNFDLSLTSDDDFYILSVEDLGTPYFYGHSGSDFISEEIVTVRQFMDIAEPDKSACYKLCKATYIGSLFEVTYVDYASVGSNNYYYYLIAYDIPLDAHTYFDATLTYNVMPRVVNFMGNKLYCYHILPHSEVNSPAIRISIEDAPYMSWCSDYYTSNLSQHVIISESSEVQVYLCENNVTIESDTPPRRY